MTAPEHHFSLSVPAAFRAVVEKHADRPALEADGVSLTYAELDLLSNGIANGLLDRGGEEPVAMVCPLEPTSLIVMLGALKAGRIFVPLDPRDPPERIALVREQLGALMVSEDELAGGATRRDDDPGLPPESAVRTLVYFTSGSTGRPRGIVKSHRQLTSPSSTFALEAGDRFAVIVPLSFAASITPVFGTLLSGATVCLFDPITRGLPLLAEWLDDTGISVLKTSPSALRTLATVLEEKGRRVSSVRLAMIAGEPCFGEHLEAVRRVLPEAVTMNVYGSTEAGNIAGTTMAPGEPVAPGPIPFRQVFAGQEVEIVDERGAPVAVGDDGEIVVRGSDVSLGYWEEPDDGEQRFFEEKGGRSVRTGDRGRFQPDGTLEHLGRTDLRVKIHGQMVDPQMVEHALGALPEIEEAVVSAVPGQTTVRLVAHVLSTSRAVPTDRDLRLALAKSLPPFMIPAVFRRVEAIPRNERGKVDRDALRRSALAAVPGVTEYVPPRTLRELAVAEILAEVLAVDPVGVHDDVFELGADSFTTVELLAAIEKRFGLDLAIADLFEAPTVAALAARVGEHPRSAERVVVPLHLDGAGTPLFLVAGGGGAGMLALRRLARRLDRPTYSFVPRGFERCALPDRTVERTSARFVQALQTVQPSGPYLIGGYSFGALVGYEMSQRLRAAGERVALLVLLDAAISDTRYRSRVQRIASGSRRDSKRRVEAVRRLVRHGALWLLHTAELATAGILPRSAEGQLRVFFLLNLRMGRRYRPKPYHGSALALRTRSWDKVDRVDLGSNLLVGETKLVDVPGGHLTVLREPHVTTLVQVLREELAAADAATSPSERVP